MEQHQLISSLHHFWKPCTSQVVQDFFHQQYEQDLPNGSLKFNSSGKLRLDPVSKTPSIWAAANFPCMHAKWNMILSVGFMAPFGMQCFAHVCLASRLGPVFFSKAHVTGLSCSLFGGLVLLPAFQHGHTCMFLRVDGRCFWLCHSRAIGFSFSQSKSSFYRARAFRPSFSGRCCRQCCRRMDRSLRKCKNREVAFLFWFGLPSVWESSTKSQRN